MIAFQVWRFRASVLSLLTSVFVVVLCDRTLAQNRITPDSSLGAERSRLVRKAGTTNVDRILGGARRGKLLFHSFDDFNIEQGGEATFANPRGVGNIFTRVTGTLETNILGTLGVDGKANLFLLNPNGIYFGPQSKLNIAGSFFASTASAFDLGDGATFRADTSEVPNLLTLRVPAGVQFGDQPGEIVSEGQLQTGRDLTLAGDRLIVSGEIIAGRDLLLQSNEDIVSEGQLVTRQDLILTGDRLMISGEIIAGRDLLLQSNEDIVSEGQLVTRQDLILTGDRLMVSGEIIAGRDLLLQGNKVLISESDRPFVGGAERNIEIEGKNRIVLSGEIRAEGNILLSSSEPIIFQGDTRIRGESIIYLTDDPSSTIANLNRNGNPTANSNLRGSGNISISTNILLGFNLAGGAPTYSFFNLSKPSQGLSSRKLEKLLRSSCNPEQDNSLVNISKGGVVPKFEETITKLWDDTRSTSSSDRTTTITKSLPKPSTPLISEATDWIKDSDGTIQLITPNTTPLAIAHQPNSCKTTLKPEPSKSLKSRASPK